MIRQFSLVELNNRDGIVDRFNLDLVNDPKGLGFTLDVTTIVTNILEIPIHVRQKLGNVTFNVNYAYGREYARADALRAWIMRKTRKRIALEWTTPVDRRYASCIITEFSFSEINQQKVLAIPLIIKQLSPFFRIRENIINIYPSQTGKEYPFTYPYTYGVGIVSNNTIENQYIEEIPLIVTLYGEMTAPSVSIAEQGQSNPYRTVQFSGLSLSKGWYITINAVGDIDERGNRTGQRVTFFNGYEEADAYDYIDQSKESFIFAKENAISFLTASVESDKSGYMEASYREYLL